MKATSEEQIRKDVSTHKTNLTVEVKNEVFYCKWGENQTLLTAHSIPFRKAHLFSNSLTNEFLQLPLEIQLMFIKVIFADRLYWLHYKDNNQYWCKIYSIICGDLVREVYDSKNLSKEQKLFFMRFID